MNIEEKSPEITTKKALAKRQVAKFRSVDLSTNSPARAASLKCEDRLIGEPITQE